MAPDLPFHRDVGQGRTIVCFHSNASHSGQWRPLADRLQDRWRVVAVDTYGAGKSLDWPPDSAGTLGEELAFVQPLLDALPPPLVLVGHSYGGALALKAALAQPARCAALVLYEPTLFTVVDRREPRRVDGIRTAASLSARHVEQGDLATAARVFIDFWMGEGSWERTPPARRPPIEQAMRNVRRWAHALLTDPAQLSDLRSLRMPVLYLTGSESPESSLSVAQVLLEVLPDATHVQLPELGHMGPVTHPDPVNARIEEFLACQ